MTIEHWWNFTDKEGTNCLGGIPLPLSLYLSQRHMDWPWIQPVPRTERPPTQHLCHGTDGNEERFGFL